MRPTLFAALLLCSACASPSPADVEPRDDAGVEDAGVDAGSKADGCASTFGHALTTGFGRVDGIVTAVVGPSDTQCALPNSDHLVVQLRMSGAVYRMVVNVQSSYGDPKVRLTTLSHALPGPAWQEGWHPGLTLDYPTDLSVHSDGGTALEMGALVAQVTDLLEVGAKISVFAHSSGGAYADSTHKIHRNGSSEDGALILSPSGPTPTMLLFHFSNQTF